MTAQCTGNASLIKPVRLADAEAVDTIISEYDGTGSPVPGLGRNQAALDFATWVAIASINGGDKQS
jgi:hypothetical protein